MMIHDAIRKQGELLFRLRGLVPLLLVPPTLVALHGSQWIEVRFGDRVDDLYEGLCFGLAALGVALRVMVSGLVPRRTSGRNARKGQVAQTLNTTGPYSVARNPLYLANGFILVGILLYTGSFWLAGVGLLAACLHYERVVCAEEAFLTERFGARYRAWAERTPAFWPRRALWAPPAQPFCWRTAAKREYSTAYAVVAGFAALDYAGDALALRRVELELDTTLPFLAATAAFLAVRILHKHTRALHVAGR